MIISAGKYNVDVASCKILDRWEFVDDTGLCVPWVPEVFSSLTLGEISRRLPTR